jgi:EAL domain-containing protein (putative c-di-GMP-specific phosphodiesterase class I)
MPPKQFVPIAEDCGLIVPIGSWVLREACTQAQAWIDAHLPPLSMAVNISGAEFRHKDFVAGVRAILRETRLNPRYLELELTETVLLQDANRLPRHSRNSMASACAWQSMLRDRLFQLELSAAVSRRYP